MSAPTPVPPVPSLPEGAVRLYRYQYGQLPANFDTSPIEGETDEPFIALPLAAFHELAAKAARGERDVVDLTDKARIAIARAASLATALGEARPWVPHLASCDESGSSATCPRCVANALLDAAAAAGSLMLGASASAATKSQNAGVNVVVPADYVPATNITFRIRLKTAVAAQVSATIVSTKLLYSAYP